MLEIFNCKEKQKQNIKKLPGTGVTVLHNAQQTFVAPPGYRRTLLHPLHTSWLCISAMSNKINPHYETIP